jgi:hypothetical protein
MEHSSRAVCLYFSLGILITTFFGAVGCNVAGIAPSTLTIPAALTIHPGDQNVPLVVSVSNGANKVPLNITVMGLPPGISVSPLTLSAGQSGTLQLSASLSADQDAFPVLGTTNDLRIVTVVGASGATVLISSQMPLTISVSNPSYSPDPSKINLPVVKIDTNGTNIIDTTTNVPGTISITSADGQTSYLPSASNTDNTATFHVHGHSTAQMPKLPYHMKLNTSLDLLGAMGMSCPYVTGKSAKAICDKSKSYILLANYDDKTFLRDWAASALANAIPMGNGYLSSPVDSPSPSGTAALMPWAPHSLFVELYLNGVYEGNYQLIEEVKVDSHRVNINELSETDTDPADITGGYLLEIDNHYEDEAYVFKTPIGESIGLIDPDFSPDPEVPSQTSYISNYVSTAETALYSGNFTDPQLGWRAYFDEASTVNFYIVNDVMGNVDGGAFGSSDYLYKNNDNALLYMGPIWDFDLSSGNANYAGIVNPTVPWMQVWAPWYAQWFQDPGFKADVISQWNTLKNNGVFDQWIASIDQEATMLQQSQANNFGRWPMQGIPVWPNPQAAGSYNGEVAYLTNWLNLRIAYLDSQFNGKAQTFTSLSMPAGTLRTGAPATLTAEVTGAAAPGGTVSFLAGGVLLGTGNLDGTGTASLTTSNLPAGNAGLQAVYNGNSANGLSASSVNSVTVLPPLLATVTSISTLVSITDNSQTFSVSVIANSIGPAAPTGTVQFVANGIAIGSASILSGGSTVFSASDLPLGSISVQAIYSGDATYQGSSSTSLVINTGQ